MPALLNLLIWIIVIIAAFSIVYWMLTRIALPAPLNTVVYVLMGVVALILLFWLATSFLGPPGHIGASFHDGGR